MEFPGCRRKRIRLATDSAIGPSTDLAFGLSRMFQIFGETKDLPFPLMVFRTMEDAIEWIGESE